MLSGTSCGSKGSGSTTAPPSSGTTPPAQANTWTIGSERISLTVNLDSAQGLRVTSLRNPATGREWSRAVQADTTLTVNGAPVGLGTSDGFRFTSAETSSDDSGSELRITFDHPSLRIRAVRHYVAYNGVSVIETYTAFESTGGSVTVGPINAWRLAVPAGTIRWITGLDTPADEGGAFTLRRRTLPAGQRLDIGSPGRSTELAVPWVGVESNGEHFFGGLMWSGAWSISVVATADRQDISAGLAPMTTALASGAGIEGPHGFFGVASDEAGAVSRATSDFFQFGVRSGRPLWPLVTYNTWFAQGAAIDELTTRDDIDHAAALGADLYVMDAGWYIGAAANGRWDFTSGLGRWQEDAGRFPSGLRALRDRAHSLGLKFGIWMEPERIALETLDEEGFADEYWLASRDGHYDPATAPDETVSAQICLAHPDAKAWVLDRVLALIDEVRPDYLKWDNNFWVNCNRGGHGHGATDGNFAHVRALYEILAAVRAQYPELLIENCSGGGHRLDFGLARYTDVGWMDDRTSPSLHVRHNLEGLSAAFPAGYLFSFVVGEEEHRAGVAEDIRLLYRSRMPGVLGIGTGMSPDQEVTAVEEIAHSRQLREMQVGASTILLTPQAGPENVGGWDVVEQLSASGDAALFAFQTDGEVESILVSPKGLDPEATYLVQSADSGLVGRATGSDLMEQGIEVVASPSSDAHLLFIRAVSRPGTSSKKR